MDVRLLYVEGCPNWQEADRRLREAIAGAGLDVDVAHVLVGTPEDAERLRFTGSPTVLVDGVDLFADGTAPVALACRLFRTPDGPRGVPTLDQLVDALGQGADPRRPEDPDDALPAHASSHLLSTSVSRLNRLRAGVLGCNDGITSTAGLVVGVAATHPSTTVLAVTGLSGLLAGSLSMGGGEFTSVRAARDSQDALLHIQRGELETIPEEELDELAHLYMLRGLSLGVARQVAVELTAHDALAAHAHAELGINLDDQVNPWEAAGASALSFLLGGALSLLAILLPPDRGRIAVCVTVVLTTLAATGYLAARFGSAPTRRAAARNLTVGAVTMAVTYALGALARTLL